MKYQVCGETNTHDIEVRRDRAGTLWVRVADGEERVFEPRRMGVGDYRLDGESRPLAVAVAGETVDVTVGGDPFRFTVTDARRAALRAGGGGGATEVRTQMPGAVVRLLVAVGDTVSDGQAVIVVEAMKMENEFKAQMDGIVSAIHVAAGDTLESGTLLISLEEPS